ncbi:MAG: DUF4058 family protein [Chloroflexi bacterium]|nr:DUF4058 family protein [Chloroflexota bacterium]MCI0575954.1 DUF4058 family protein [Chloroflexota bacterium]MCI0648141.1 DUF4058 family protein [Chloroflexota bacterium]MCI0729591.1 DUF4058 family protein [Chloroflexota bacterium]
MPSPFPGMDPYLEGYLWPDVHNALANKIRQQLAPRLRPRYVARLEIYVVEDKNPEAEIGIMYPDVEILTAQEHSGREATAVWTTPAEAAEALTPPPLTLPILGPLPVHITAVEIRDAAQNELVTSIEILSPVNKREPGLDNYRQKRQRLREAAVHLLEINLLRRGTRPLLHPRLPESAYLVMLTRARANAVEVWPLGLRDPLPVVPVPLRAPDPDVPLELSPALAAVYEEAAYDLSIDYRQPPPPPPLTAEDQQWRQELLTKQR